MNRFTIKFILCLIILQFFTMKIFSGCEGEKAVGYNEGYIHSFLPLTDISDLSIREEIEIEIIGRTVKQCIKSLLIIDYI